MNNRHHKIAYYIAIVLLVVASGVGYMVSMRGSSAAEAQDQSAAIPADEIAPGPTDIVPTTVFETVPDASFMPIRQGKEIRINLVTMLLSRYENGSLLDTATVIGKGKIGSYWETPSGTYTVNDKEEDYYSDRADAWFPYSLHLFGNYFIHGVPHDEDSRQLTRLAAGDIRLSNDDAKKIFEWADTTTKVSILSDSTKVPEPLLSGSPYIVENGKRVPNISAEAYLVGDLDTGDIIVQKNQDAKFPIASVSKLMTAIVSLDTMNQFEYTRVSKKAVNSYSVSRFTSGEKIQLGNLLYPLLLPSSNVAAEIIAEHLGRDTFMQAMNNRADDLGMTATSYEDPSGLSPHNTSTPTDLFTLTRYIKKNKSFIFDLTTKPSYSAEGHVSKNISQFLKDSRYTGGKSGQTDAAKQSVIATFAMPISEWNTRHIAIVLLRSNDRYTDTMKLLSFIDKSVSRTDQAFRLGNGAGPDDVTLLFGGDIMLDRGVKYSVNKNFGGDYAKLFEHLQSIKDADIAFANLEGPASDKGADIRNLYSFRMDPKVVGVLGAAGFDVLSFANNHIGDWGREAFEDTVARLRTAGIGIAGAGMNKADAEAPYIIEKKGVRFGFIALSDVGPKTMEATETTSGIILGNDKRLAEIVKNAASKVDFLTVSMHAGVEYSPHTDRQAFLAHLAIDNGARLVIGHHPHVAQDIEKYKGGLIAYSLGNFIFDQGFSDETMRGMMLEVIVRKGEIERYTKKIVPFNQYFQPQKPEVEK